MISSPTSLSDLTVPEGAVVRAGGTDLQERLRSRVAPPDLVDLMGIEGFAGIEVTDAGIRIGAGTRMAVVAGASTRACRYWAAASSNRPIDCRAAPRLARAST